MKLRTTLEELASSCLKYISITKENLTGAGSGKTKLDKERMKLCQREIVIKPSNNIDIGRENIYILLLIIFIFMSCACSGL